MRDHTDAPKATEPPLSARPPDQWPADEALPYRRGAVPTDGELPPVALSIVVPTRNEADNVEELVRRLDCALADTPKEVIFVDDSDDRTPDVINQLRAQGHCDLVLIHRPPGRRGGGLGGAVVEGLRRARAPWVCVMDGDLQHPPDLVPQLLATAERGNVDLVVASRYCAQGDAGGFGHLRAAISQSSTAAARLLFSHRLRDVSDPMSGFFLVRREAVPVERLRPCGFKILLEIIGRTPGLRAAEVPFQFGSRHAGQSKASFREGLRYLRLLIGLRFDEAWLRFLRFGLVGATGLLVNFLLLAGATELLGIFYLLSAVLATQASTLWNFSLSETWVFRHRFRKAGRARRCAMFFLMNNLALGIRGPLLFALTSLLGLHYLLSNFVSLVVLLLLRYASADRLIWGRVRSAAVPTASGDVAASVPLSAKRIAVSAPVYRYNIHDIVTVASEARLPELELFRTDAEIGQPTIRVRIGKPTSSRRRVLGEPRPDSRYVRYDEGLGPCGFGIEIEYGDVIDVVATPFLRRSPHVLYTNVVEPILRWAFVEKGYALVHGACLADGEEAFLITARTDTGKTTTVLRLLDSQPTWSFLSDDLTLLSPDGRVLTYPKPLTISRHTLVAVHSPLLSRPERFALFFQSRVHSKSGRWFGLFLAKSHLPMATTNALVQLLVPPPKYQVRRLVPHTTLAREARLAGLIVIERGGTGEVHLDEQQAVEILMSNCEDSYGFPPYATIKHCLHGEGDRDLRPLERATVQAALKGLPAALIRSEQRDWWQRLPAFVSRVRAVAAAFPQTESVEGAGVWSPAPAIRFAAEAVPAPMKVAAD